MLFSAVFIDTPAMSDGWLLQDIKNALGGMAEAGEKKTRALRILKIASNPNFVLVSDGSYSIIALISDGIIPPLSTSADNSGPLLSVFTIYVNGYHFICREIYDMYNHCRSCPF